MIAEMSVGMNVSRCENCGYMGRAMFDTCPSCRSTGTIVTACHSRKAEATKLLCQAFDITPNSAMGKLVKQAVDLIVA